MFCFDTLNENISYINKVKQKREIYIYFEYVSFQTKSLGNLALSTTVAAGNPTSAQFLAVVNALNNIGTPDC